MTARLAIGLSLFAIACSSSPTGGFSDDAGSDAPPISGDSAPPADSHAADTAPDPVDAGPLGAACDPTMPASCPDGLLCFGFHTEQGWGCEGLSGCQPDMYGRCYVTCTNGTGGEDACNRLGGLCGCPVIAGNDAGWECLPGGSMVCVRTTR